MVFFMARMYGWTVDDGDGIWKNLYRGNESPSSGSVGMVEEKPYGSAVAKVSS